MATGRHLLIISCSKRKRTAPRPLPAVELYDGPVYRTLRRYSRQIGSSPVDTLIISARHGCILPETLLDTYDETLSSAVDPRFVALVSSQFLQLTQQAIYASVLVSLSDRYLQAITDCLGALRGSPEVEFTTGRIGKRLRQVKLWLESRPKGVSLT